MAIWLCPTTRLELQMQDVVPGICGTRSNDERGTAIAGVPPPGLDVLPPMECNENPASMSAGVPVSLMRLLMRQTKFLEN